MDQSSQFSTDERILAAVSHASAFLPVLGIMVPLGIWIYQREKSPWVRFQSLQAVVYQTLQFLVILLASCLVLPLLIGVLFVAAKNPDTAFPLIFFAQFSPYIVWGLIILVALLAGVLCAFGIDFRYPILGRRLEKYLEVHPEQLDKGEELD